MNYLTPRRFRERFAQPSFIEVAQITVKGAIIFSDHPLCVRCWLTSAIRCGALFEDSSVPGDRHNLPRDEFAAVAECRFRSTLQPAAAWNFHPDDGHALNVIFPDDCSKLFGIIHRVQLRAADQGDLSLHEILMHVGISVGSTVCCNQQLCAFKERSLRRQELDLARPLVQALHHRPELLFLQS